MPSKGTDRERGYDYRHKQLRKHLAPKVATGKVNCWRCQQPITPTQQWDLGHDDDDRTKYRGPEHALAKDCPAGGNRATAGRNLKRPDQSRRW